MWHTGSCHKCISIYLSIILKGRYGSLLKPYCMTSWVMSCRSHPLHPINSCMPQFLHYFLTRVLTPSLMRSNWTSQWLLNLSFSLALLSLSFFPPSLFLPRALTPCPVSHAVDLYCSSSVALLLFCYLLHCKIGALEMLLSLCLFNRIIGRKGLPWIQWILSL
jgi:hypothetical protein